MPSAARSGQAFLETLVVLLVLCLALFGFLQIALSAGEREVLHHAAARAARAKAVGFNDWMAAKAARVAAIPVSGRLLEGAEWDGEGGTAGRTAFELSRIPSYLASENHARAEWILDYEEWKNGALRTHAGASLLGDGMLRYRVDHRAPLLMPFSRYLVPSAETDAEGVPRVSQSAAVAAGEHAGLYLK